MLTEKTYHENFIKAIRLLMAEWGLESLKDVAGELGISYMILYKIMTKKSSPTIDQCIIVCLRGGFSANWMFLNKGQRQMNEITTMDKVIRRLANIENKL